MCLCELFLQLFYLSFYRQSPPTYQTNYNHTPSSVNFSTYNRYELLVAYSMANYYNNVQHTAHLCTRTRYTRYSITVLSITIIVVGIVIIMLIVVVVVIKYVFFPFFLFSFDRLSAVRHRFHQCI